MSIFAFETVATISTPFDPGHEITVRKLSGWQLGKAQKAFFNELVGEVTERGGAKVQKDIETLFAKDPTAADEAGAEIKGDPLNGYDKYTVIALGLKAMSRLPGWATLSPEAKLENARELDEEARDFFATEIMRLTKPGLFRTAEEREADQKNG